MMTTTKYVKKDELVELAVNLGIDKDAASDMKRDELVAKIEEAKANLESEKLNAQSEVERAKGAAKAIEIEGGSLTPEYIQYLWIRQLDLSASKTIYIPTEAGLPILEAGKRP